MLHRLLQANDALSPACLALRLLLVALLLRPAEPWWLRAGVLSLCVLGLGSRRFLLAPALWAALTALLTARLVVDWPLPDNHIYLFAYTCLAVFLAALHPAGARLLAESARWLLAATFTFAVLWKAVLSADYRDGRFFTVTLITEQRFTAVVRLLGGLGAYELDANRRAFAPLPAESRLAEPPSFYAPPAFRRLVLAATWGGLWLESALALAFLLPGRAASLRHPLLLVFCAATYALAPVAGFGWLLLVLGLTQQPSRVFSSAYLACFLLVLLYAEVPWAELLLSLSHAG